MSRHNSARSRNLRLTAIRSFFRYAALEAPAESGIIQRVLAIPNQRFEQTGTVKASKSCETRRSRMLFTLCDEMVPTLLSEESIFRPPIAVAIDGFLQNSRRISAGDYLHNVILELIRTQGRFGQLWFRANLRWSHR